jgi:tetrahydromethanopterin S-methyltransferase subunit G
MPAERKPEASDSSPPEHAGAVPLRDYMVALLREQEKRFEQRLSDMQIALAAALAAVEKATVKSELAVESRLTGMNEFRSQMADQQATLVRKSEVDYRFDALEKKVDTAIAQLQTSKGREAGLGLAWGIVVVVVTLILSAVGVVLAVMTRHS